MALGSLATIGMARPRNLTIIMDNGNYQITGKQKAATAGTADIVAIARGAGIAESHWVRNKAHFDRLTSGRFDEGGPLVLRDAGMVDPRRPFCDVALHALRHRFGGAGAHLHAELGCLLLDLWPGEDL